MNTTSAVVRLNAAHVKKDGSSAIYLQVIINRKTQRYRTTLHWPASHFDNPAGLCLPRHKGDTEATDYNLLLSRLSAKAKEIFIRYRLSEKILTHDAFASEFYSQYSRNSFTDFFKDALERRRKNRDITHATYRTQLQVLRRLLGFGACEFADFDGHWAERYTAYLKRCGIKSQNTLWNHHKTIKTYILKAIKQKLSFFNPYEEYKIRETVTKVDSLTREEYQAMRRLYYGGGLPVAMQHALRRFLFSCLTGMRVGDMMAMKYEWVMGELLIYVPRKTVKNGKVARVPLVPEARRLLAQAQEYFPTRPFAQPGEQYSNRLLKQAAILADVKANVHHHVGRHTFSDLYLKMGGKVQVLQRLLCHKDTAMTLRYSHVDDVEQASEMIRFIELDD